MAASMPNTAPVVHFTPSRRRYQFILLGEQRHMCVNNLPRVTPSGGTAGNRTRDLSITNPTPYRYTTKPHGYTDIIRLKAGQACKNTKKSAGLFYLRHENKAYRLRENPLLSVPLSLPSSLSFYFRPFSIPFLFRSRREATPLNPA